MNMKNYLIIVSVLFVVTVVSLTPIGSIATTWNEHWGGRDVFGTFGEDRSKGNVDPGLFHSGIEDVSGIVYEHFNIQAPSQVILQQNYPNPFNPNTTIAYQVPVGTYNYTSLRIYDTMGRLVKTLVDEKQEAGYHTVQWHGRDDNGRQVPSGIYVYRLETTDGYEETRKMILLK